jgi:CHAD domain-containing protein
MPAHRTAHAVATGELRAQLAAWAQHEPGARLGTNADELHQLRVAVRRIEAVLSLFRGQLPAPLVRMRMTAKGLLRSLGAARDYDVQLAELERYCAKATAAERTAAAPLRERLESDREQARARMLRVLDSEATRAWLAALAAGVYGPADPSGGDPAAVVVPERVRKRFRKLRKEVRRVGAKSAMEEFHSVRRRAKLLRYALEPGVQLYGKSAEELLKALRRMQDKLGAQQDAQIAKQHLEALAADTHTPLPAETLFLMGRLAEHQLRITAGARNSLERAWKKVSGKRWKMLRARMRQLATEAKQASLRATAAATEDAIPGTLPAAESQVLRH